MELKIYFTAFFFSLVLQLQAQLTAVQQHKIDSIFSSWDKPNHPGGVVGIIQKDQQVYLKAFGLASMEYTIPNTTGTIFNTGSVSKQFTAMGIVLLHLQGKISVDDDIRKYLPELEHFEHTVTIRQMLHHTSGLRSLHALLGLAGWRGDDSRTNDDLNRFMKLQRDLNFTPGDEYLYCNTGYMLMVNIIEKVTGEKFPLWMKKSVFEPLGMTNTYVEDNYARIVPNNATSYYPIGDGTFNRAVEYWGYVGSGNMHSTATDLLAWLTNFYQPKAGWEDAFKTLQTLDKFNNGIENPYAFGVIIGSVNGTKSVGHSGSIGGFRANVIAYPEKELGIAVLSNFSTGNPGGKTNAVTEVLLGKPVAPVISSKGKKKAVRISKEELASVEGMYWNDIENYSRRIYQRNDTLWYSRNASGETALIPQGKSVFRMNIPTSDILVKFETSSAGKSLTIIENSGSPTVLVHYIPVAETADELEGYAGVFYSYELETAYTFYMKGADLYYHHPRHGDFKMTRIRKDVLEGEYPLGFVKFKKDSEGRITGVLVSNGRVRNSWFEKMK